MSATFWLVSIAGFFVMFLAQSTFDRMGLAVQPSLIKRLPNGFIVGFSMGVMNVFQFFAKPLTYAILFFLPAITDKISPADKKLSRSLKIWHIIAGLFAISILMQFIIGVAIYRTLPPRAVSLSMWQMYLTWSIMLIFFYRGKLLHSEPFRKFSAKFRWPVLILSVLVSANFIDCVKDLSIAPEYAAKYDARTEAILAQAKSGMTDLRLFSIEPAMNLITPERGIGRSDAIAKYYGAERIHFIPNELAVDEEAVEKFMSGDIEALVPVAEKGNLYAIRLLGNYRNPRNNPDKPEAWDIEEAEKWYRMGAELGGVLCMKPLARILLNKNFLEAVWWLTKYHILITRL